MSAVIPKDLTGLVPHPTKMDCWIPGQRSNSDNLCMEIPMPAHAETQTCTLAPVGKPAIEVFNEISINWKVQIYNNVQRRYGGTKANLIVEQAIALMPEDMVEKFSDALLEELKLPPKEAAVILKTAMEEHITMMSAFAMHQSMKESGNMQELTKAVEHEVEKFSMTEMLGKEPEPTAEQFVNPKRVGKKAKKKGAKRRTSINMGNKTVKRLMGANILHMLGNVQQQHSDATKKALLKELPAADLVEVATGKKLPDYQANLINQFQAKADPTAPIVTKMQEGVDRTKEEVLAELQTETAKVLELIEDSMPRVRMEWSESRGEAFHVTRKGFDEMVFSTEHVFEDAAEELQTSIKFVEDRAKGNEFLAGLDKTIREFEVEVDITEVQDDPRGLKHIYRRLLNGYVEGFVKGMADSAVKVAAATAVETTPAVLG